MAKKKTSNEYPQAIIGIRSNHKFFTMYAVWPSEKSYTAFFKCIASSFKNDVYGWSDIYKPEWFYNLPNVYDALIGSRSTASIVILDGDLLALMAAAVAPRSVNKIISLELKPSRERAFKANMHNPHVREEDPLHGEALTLIDLGFRDSVPSIESYEYKYFQIVF